MPAKKTKKRREKKSRLSDKDIIKLLKKLRPKNQQIVRVNVGDKADKKKDSQRLPQSNIVPVLTYAAPPQQQQQYFPAPPPPLPISQQPQLQPLIIPPPSAPAAPTPRQKSLFSESESETPVKVRKPRGKKSTIASDFLAEELKREQEIAQRLYEYESRDPYAKQFKNPRRYQESNLGNVQERFFAGAVQNDPYLPPEFEDTTTDSAGVISSSLSSDEWRGTPEGEIEFQPLQGSEAAAAATEPLETVPAPEESFTGRPIGSQSVVDRIRNIPVASAFGEEEPNWAEQVQLSEILPPTPPETRPATAATPAGGVDPILFNPDYEGEYLKNLVRDAPKTAQGLMKDEIVQKLKGGFQGVPPEYLTKTGRLRTKLSVDDLYNLYTSL
jgi:hypothetical protein